MRRRVQVAPGEVTCLLCGEVFSRRTWPGCPRCNGDRAPGTRMRITPTVPTVAYLREGEYEMV